MYVPELKKPNFKGLKRGSFRRPTTEKEIQTLDIGVGSGRRFKSKAEKRPERKYVGVDLSVGIEDVNGNNYTIRGGVRANDYLQLCINKGIKVRNINFDLPTPLDNVYRIEEFFEKLPKVLMPNGKVFMNSENKAYLESIMKIALADYYSVRLKAIPITEYLKYSAGKLNGFKISEYMQAFFANKAYTTLYQLEITYSLSKAYKTKEERRNWTKQ